MYESYYSNIKLISIFAFLYIDKYSTMIRINTIEAFNSLNPHQFNKDKLRPIRCLQRQCQQLCNNGYKFELIISDSADELHLIVTSTNGTMFHFYELEQYPFCFPELEIN